MEPAIAIGLVAVLWLAIMVYNAGRRDKDLPPGPPTIPLLGNLHIFPTNRPFAKSVIFSSSRYA